MIVENSVCEKNQFTCSNKRCVKSSSTCDGVNDCGDNSDEIIPCSGILEVIDIDTNQKLLQFDY